MARGTNRIRACGLLHRFVVLTSATRNLHSVLHAAAYGGSEECTTKLTGLDAPAAADGQGSTPLHVRRNDAYVRGRRHLLLGAHQSRLAPCRLLPID